MQFHNLCYALRRYTICSPGHLYSAYSAAFKYGVLKNLPMRECVPLSTNAIERHSPLSSWLLEWMPKEIIILKQKEWIIKGHAVRWKGGPILGKFIIEWNSSIDSTICYGRYGFGKTPSSSVQEEGICPCDNDFKIFIAYLEDYFTKVWFSVMHACTHEIFSYWDTWTANSWFCFPPQ